MGEEVSDQQMASSTVCCLVIDSPAEGAWNMALDEALLLSAEQEGIAWLRFYTWQEPTLSLGYFQSHSDRQLHSPSANCKLVRRASGGGAILHDRELTYSIALPASHALARHPQLLYDAAHQTLIETLDECGIKTALHPGESPKIHSERPPPQPFLCFQRRSPGDVILGEHKIAGSAQRRHRGAVLQHGSVIWSKSMLAPELFGIFDLTKKPAQKEGEIRGAWQIRLAERLNFQLENTSVSHNVLTIARTIQSEKFGSEAWTLRR